MAVDRASDNPFPSVLFAEHVDPSNPDAGYKRLFVDTDHILKTIDSSGTIVQLGQGLTDPMTTRGDIIYRNASNVTDRLGRGTSGQVLTSDGTDLSWQTPSSGFSDPMTTRGDIIVRNSSNTTARLAVGSAAKMSLTSDGTDALWAVPAGTLLAYKVGTSDVTTTSASFVDADATNLAITFTAPPSTNVLVRLTGMMSPSAGGAEAVGTVSSWGLRESTTNIAGSAGGTIVARVLVSGATVTDIRYVSAAFVLTGISAGSHTYKWAFATSAGTTKLYGATDIMEVWSL